jgi:hypothetical protein
MSAIVDELTVHVGKIVTAPSSRRAGAGDELRRGRSDLRRSIPLTAYTVGISPPSTRRTEPVMYEARSLARNATAAAYSAGSP